MNYRIGQVNARACAVLGLLVICGAWSGLSVLAAEPAAPPAPAAPAPAEGNNLKLLEAQVKAAVARVTACTVGVRNGSSSGSGVIVSEDGRVLTAGHVVGKPGQEVVILMPDGKQLKGQTLGAYKTADAGMLKITDAGPFPTAPRGRSADVQVGQWCIATGHPLGYQDKRPPVVRVGRVQRVADNVIQTDCPLVGGDSGGPLFDLEGRVIGINSRIGGAMNQNFHVPVDVFQDNWERLVKGDEWEDVLPGRTDQQMKTALGKLVAAAGKCAVRVLCDGKEAVLGTVVGPDGWIVTKASELKGKITCRLADQRELEARIVGIDPRFDLAMLKVEAFDLPRIDWTLTKPDVGQWVAAPGADGKPLALGVVSVPRRPIALTPGILGVIFKDAPQAVEIERVLEKSPAEKAGLKVNDLIVAINGKPTPDRTKAVAIVKKFPPGTALTLKVKRGDEQLDIKATLGLLNTPATRKRDMQNALGVGVSKRRDAFPLVLQHDTVLAPADCGGPLVDLDGKAVGVNIARGGRTETYSVPSDVLVMLMYDLMSGRLTPPQIVQARAAEAAQKKQAAEKAAAEKAAAEKAAAEKAAAEKAAADKAAADKKQRDEKAAAEKAAAEKAAAEKPAAERPDGEKTPAARQPARSLQVRTTTRGTWNSTACVCLSGGPSGCA